MTITCGNIAITLTAAQARELEYVARWRADLEYIRERFGADDPEADTSRKSIECGLDQCDALNIPYWLQNAALSFGENWREYLKCNLWDYIRNKPGYTLQYT